MIIVLDKDYFYFANMVINHFFQILGFTKTLYYKDYLPLSGIKCKVKQKIFICKTL